MIVITMTVSSFADVTVGKEWDDGLSGTSANGRVTPTVSLSGETSYEKLLNLFYPVGTFYISKNASFDPNTEWGGTWVKVDAGKTIWTTTTADDVGTNVAAGLPNITGAMSSMAWNTSVGLYNFGTTGAFYRNETKPSGRVTCEDTYWGSGSTNSALLAFNASRANSIYGNSSTVQPPAVKVFIWERTA